ncbi:permease [Ktedonosporobacter rubrisoli]|uniref:Permease n=2 Tax=Ktedonosporobacter rubrisoli TaxID=2509675 RepID=A0A4P6K620_KTERU|nr:permease [Ktedonosporobacter rubrisoli]
MVTFFSTLLGGLAGIRYRTYLYVLMGFTAGVLVGVVVFDLLPEIFQLVSKLQLDITGPMLALMLGFLVFHIVEKTTLIHFSHENNYAVHSHPLVGLISAIALSCHSFLDGVGIGLGFQVNTATGIMVAIAVIAHDFSDGLNTVTLMIVNKNTSRRAFFLLLLDAITPTLGAISTLFFTIPDSLLVLYLGFFAGFLLYIGASDILPQAHSEKSSALTVLLTVVGAAFIFLVTRFV